MQNKNSFLGKGWAFPPEFSHNDNPTRMSNYEEDIRQSLIILLSTRTGENTSSGLRYGTISLSV
jgi:phage baseplate assembly protein W